MLKQKIQLKAQRTRRHKSAVGSINKIRYSKRTLRSFRGKLKKAVIDVKKPSSLEERQKKKLCENVQSNPKKYNPNKELIKRVQERIKDKPAQEWKNTTRYNISQDLRKSQIWKSAEGTQFLTLSSVINP